MNGIYDIETISLGEFRMATIAYGVLIKCDAGLFDALQHSKVFIANSGTEPMINKDESTDGRHLILLGQFDTFIFDLKELQISLHRTTVRTPDGIYSEETPILNNSTRHLDTNSGDHYYIQFPFVPNETFNEVWKYYLESRVKQIRELRNAP